MTLEEGMPTFSAAWHPAVSIVRLGRHETENRETRKLVLGTHTGTHVDAPLHFVKGGAAVDALPLTDLVGPAEVLDFSRVPDRTEISVGDLESEIRSDPPVRLLLRFDWDLKAGRTARYFTDHPYLSEEACRWLVRKGCRVLALDTPQPDNPENGRGSGNDSPNHRILLRSGVLIVEYLVHLNRIGRRNVSLVVAPLKVKDGDGAPARCFVMENEK